ncbi:hypothetical protein MRB53_019361 [Persea americana]|uniref:Uncharacterized protein n=1 Tax=Persea americana TaxID=3435 RepID=A0ACC2KZ26_PERAE|nr:hypothetical protein MRB53_019361 [Persea americana]
MNMKHFPSTVGVPRLDPPPMGSVVQMAKSWQQLTYGFEGSESKEEEGKQVTDMGLKEEFEEYAEKAKALPETISNENKLILYANYKQATVGPVNTTRPGMFNIKDRAKWDAWKIAEGKSTDEAMSDYITKVKQLQEEVAASVAT